MAESKRIKPDQLGDSIDIYLEQLGDDVVKATREDIDAIAESTVEELHRTSPKRTGRYAGSWTHDMEQDDAGKPVAHIYNAKYGQLTHLLEHGHGGPHPAPPKPHIEAAAIKARGEMERRFKRG